MSARTGWPVDDLEYLAGPAAFDFAAPDAYRDERALRRLADAFTALTRLGASAALVAPPDTGWIAPEIGAAAARSIKQAVKAQYVDEQWLGIARRLKDTVRDKQRAALVACTVAQSSVLLGRHLEDANDLFGYLLVDVEMSPCATTSRVKQASGSVQLFVQRCLMGLEHANGTTVVLDEETARQWKWRSSYRVWEANRKVFLYPENWTQPELRDDKSPPFEDLENQLLQNDVTSDLGEEAFSNYLAKLDEVARLEIVGMYHQAESHTNSLMHGGLEVVKTLDTLHVFDERGRIRHIYYYRRRVGSSILSSLDGVDKGRRDIEGNHLIPVVWNRRLHLLAGSPRRPTRSRTRQAARKVRPNCNTSRTARITSAGNRKICATWRKGRCGIRRMRRHSAGGRGQDDESAVRPASRRLVTEATAAKNAPGRHRHPIPPNLPRHTWPSSWRGASSERSVGSAEDVGRRSAPGPTVLSGPGLLVVSGTDVLEWRPGRALLLYAAADVWLADDGERAHR